MRLPRAGSTKNKSLETSVSRGSKLLDLERKQFSPKKAPALKNWLSNRRSPVRRSDSNSRDSFLIENGKRQLFDHSSDSDQEIENRENRSKKRRRTVDVSDDDDVVSVRSNQSNRSDFSVKSARTGVSVKTGLSHDTGFSAHSTSTSNSTNGSKVRFTISYISSEKNHKFRLTEFPHHQMSDFFHKIQKEISRREDKALQIPLISVFVLSDGDEIELIPSDISEFKKLKKITLDLKIALSKNIC